MSNANWPGSAGFPALPFRGEWGRKSIQLPFATGNAETDAPEIIWGAGSPEGAIVGSPGDIYVPIDSGDASVWKKKTGVATNTGWSQITGQAVVGGGGGGSGSAGGGVGFLPTAPFIGHVMTPGSASFAPFIHLFNPSASGVLLTINELMLVVAGATSSVTCRVRRTPSPISLHGGGETIATALPLKLDETDTLGVLTELAGTNIPGSVAAFTEATSQWVAKLGVEGNAGFQPTFVRPPGAFPWIVKPGSALELTTDTVGATNKLRAIAVWDEAAIPA